MKRRMFRYSPDSDARVGELHELTVALRLRIGRLALEPQIALLRELLDPQERDAARAAHVGRQDVAVELLQLLVGLALPVTVARAAA